MAQIIHARLDNETESLRRKLEQRMGWTDSELVRAGIKSLASMLTPNRSQVIGLGEFDSGIPGLGTNNKHLDGFGR